MISGGFKNALVWTVVTLFIVLGTVSFLIFSSSKNPNSISKVSTFSNEYTLPTIAQVVSTTPTIIITLTPTPTITPQPNTTPTPTDIPWGPLVHKFGVEYLGHWLPDSTMDSPKNIAQAANNYRAEFGKNYLAYADDLGKFAQQRAEFYVTNGQDQHAGFISSAPDFAKQNGYVYLGEDAYSGNAILGIHLVEWAFAQDEGHRAILLTRGTHIGVGVAGNATTGYGVDVIIGSKP